MRYSARSFFEGLNVDSKHFLKQFKIIGVQSRFFFTSDDLKAIKEKLPVTRYKSAKIVERANNLLEAEKCHA